jgi:lysophospholipase L1-like esterase
VQKHPTGHGVMLLALIVALVAIVVVTFVAVAQRHSAPTVEVVGDSITFFAGRDITAALGTKYDSDVDAGIGKRIDEMLPALQAAVRKHPFAVVVNLGSNDARQAQTHPDWHRGFEQMTALLIPMRCVLVTTINTGMDGQPGTNIVASEINQAISATVTAHHNLHMVDWNAAVHGTNGTNLLTPDHIHPSAAGQLTLASLVRAALSANCRQH